MDEAPNGQPIACTLSPADAEAQLTDWSGLQRMFRRAETTPTGVRMWFDASADARLRAVVEKEAMCCAFLTLQVAPDDGLIRLEIATHQQAAQPVIDLLVAEASGRSLG